MKAKEPSSMIQKETARIWLANKTSRRRFQAAFSLFASLEINEAYLATDTIISLIFKNLSIYLL